MSSDKPSSPNELWDSGFAAGAGEAFERERRRKRRRIKPILEDAPEKSLFPYFIGLLLGMTLIAWGFLKLKDEIYEHVFGHSEKRAYYSIDV